VDDRVFLILSGAYVQPEMVAEFGNLPPAFLPLGLHRLFQRQIEFARRFDARLFMTLPLGFAIEEFDRNYLDSQSVQVLWVDPTSTLSTALLCALDQIRPAGWLWILHGDTLVDVGPGIETDDTFGVGETDYYAKWAEYDWQGGAATFREGLSADRSKRSIVCGSFCFADAKKYHQSLHETGNFIRSLNAYAAERPFSPLPVSRWLDFGHLHTYYQSKRSELVTRISNGVRYTNYAIRKTGSPQSKIRAEANWYESAPTALRPFLPAFLGESGQHDFSYDIEYLHLPTLSELFVFGRLPGIVWRRILASCQEFLAVARSIPPSQSSLPLDLPRRFHDDMIVAKTHDRLASFARQRRLDLRREWRINGVNQMSLERMADRLISRIRETRHEDIGFFHGDFHFANILYDFRSCRIRVVDPRGMLTDGTPALYGDRRYDLAKLAHSVIGLYDFILAGRYRLLKHGEYDLDLDLSVSSEIAEIQSAFGQSTLDSEAGRNDVLSLTALLFFTMLPVHSEDADRQDALLANGYRIAAMIEQNQ